MKILVATHGYLADGYKSSLTILAGEAEHVHYINAYVDDSDVKIQIQAFFESNLKENILVFTDIFHGSINQYVMPYLSDNVVCVTGFNLPLFLEATLSARDLSKSEIVEMVHLAKDQLCVVELIKQEETEFF